MPTEHYASATEIFEYSKLLARTFDLYPSALFQTDVTGADWDEESLRWRVTTSRGDRLSGRFLVLAGGILHKAKLPGIPGHRGLRGQGLPHQPLGLRLHRRKSHRTDGPAGRQTGRHHRHRGHRRAGGAAGRPGGQGALRVPAHPECGGCPQPAAHRCRVVPRASSPAGSTSGSSTSPRRSPVAQPEVDLVHDGWTEMMWVDTQKASIGGGGRGARADRLRGDGGDPATRRRDRRGPRHRREAQAVLGKHCKRVCFHDDYLPAFNRPNVHLVDTEGRGVDQITARGPWSTGWSTRWTSSSTPRASKSPRTCTSGSASTRRVPVASRFRAMGERRPHAARCPGQRVP